MKNTGQNKVKTTTVLQELPIPGPKEIGKFFKISRACTRPDNNQNIDWDVWSAE